ncbi:21 kDa subunit of NADH dehydrogenase [Pseudovirgaria hyperparasitica]|uniref:21 kDa subunit of NADH dehydrogenase n=1 Tax=Pseudovirgaria hyperparasitica TaxID=470096 RepID=A0A6A6WEL0_9PEZI|nr:21 kDa subunit of NADH dehydrogenase [Pseudovirgaria hyperparasitica]KAF2759551.1 21 kDa subunit of NADH dehydrogenase [Pseudovirgaria hyperparasitica]
MSKQAAAQFKKYTVQPTGIWAKINNLLAVDPKRSTGVPLNPQFRNPPPGANDPTAYDDPVTLPAGDIAENPYWKRDVRRRYQVPSVVSQGDVVGLLTVGSKESPNEQVLQIGDAGAKQLVAIKEEGEKGLSAFLAKEKGVGKLVLGEDGLPPRPANLGPQGKKNYEMLEDQTYGNDNQ